MSRIGLGWRLGLVGVCLVLAPAVRAAVFVVDDAGTTVDATPGDGVCADAMGRCTWPAAVGEANALAGPDVIALPAGTYAGTSAFFSDAVEVVGQGVGATILDGQGTRRLVVVDELVAVTFRGVEFTDGSASEGAAILNAGDLTVLDCAFTINATSNSGGAISSFGTLIVERTTFSSNSSPAGAGIFQGGVAMATVRDSTFYNNVSTVNASAIHTQIGSTLTLENVTIVGNLGGTAVVLAGTASATITHSTIASNQSFGLAVNEGTSLTIANTIVANNGIGQAFADDCFAAGSVTTLGGNLSSDTSCNFDDATDLETTEPGLLGLADNGGATLTTALSMVSAAVDTAKAAECLATDQRGVSRPVGVGCDRGAYERGGVVPTSTTTTFPTTTSTTSSTSTSTTTSSTTSSSTIVSTTSTSSSTTSTVGSTTSTSVSTTISSTATSTSLASTTTSTSVSTTTSSSATSTSLASTTTSSAVSTTSSSTTTVPSTTSTSSVPTSTTVSTTTTTTIGTTTSTTLPGAALLPGKKLLVKRKKSGTQRLQLVVKDASVAATVPCEVDGELVIEARGAGGPVRRFPLAAEFWKPLKAKKPERGCRYRKGPIVATVQVKAGKVLKVVASGDDLGVPLTTDPRPVRIEIRHGDVRHCAEFGGEKGKHVPDKKLLAKRAAAAAACPGDASPSGAFVD